MDFEDIVLSEISQTKKDNYIWNLKKKRNNRNKHTDKKKHTGGCQKWEKRGAQSE